MSEFRQKTWHATDETLSQIEQIGKEVGALNISATIRYCIKQEFNRLQQQRKEAV